MRRLSVAWVSGLVWLLGCGGGSSPRDGDAPETAGDVAPEAAGDVAPETAGDVAPEAAPREDASDADVSGERDAAADVDGGLPDGAGDGATDANRLARMWSCPSPSGQLGAPACAASGLLDLGSGVASGFDVNDRGDVATGGSQYQTGIFLGKERCFVMTPLQTLLPIDMPGGVDDVLGLNGRSTLATSVNTPHGEAGYACNGDCNGFRYFVPHPTPSTGVMFSDSWFMGLNDSDQFVGYAKFTVSTNGIASTYTHAYLWQWPSGPVTAAALAGQDLSDPSLTGMTNPVGSGTDLAVAINASGQVAGAAGAHAALWSGGTKTDLGTLGGNLSRATGINAAGQVIGVSKTASGATHAFIWSGGVMTDLVSLAGASGSSVATAINSSGQVAGTSTTAGGTVHAFSWKNGVMTDLGTLGGTASMASSPTALAVSPATPPGGAWTTSMAGIPLASPNLSTASPALLPRGRRAINDAGQIVGTSTTATGQTHAFVWTAGVMKDLGTLGGTYSEGAAINSLGQATGVANVTGDTASHGFLYDPAGCL